MADNRPPQKYKVGDNLRSNWHDVTGIVQEVDWSVTFGQWTYLIFQTEDSRYAASYGEAGTCVWVCESDLKPQFVTSEEVDLVLAQATEYGLDWLRLWEVANQKRHIDSKDALRLVERFKQGK